VFKKRVLVYKKFDNFFILLPTMKNKVQIDRFFSSKAFCFVIALWMFHLASCKESADFYPETATFDNADVYSTSDGFGMVVDYNCKAINGITDFDSVGYYYIFDNQVYKEIFADSLQLYKRFVPGKGVSNFSGSTYGLGLNTLVKVRPAIAAGGRISFGEEKSVQIFDNGLPITSEYQSIKERNQITCIVGDEGVLMGGGIIVNTQNQLTSFYKLDVNSGVLSPTADISGGAGCVGPMGFYRNGKYYLVGGKSNGVAIDAIWSYSANSDTWTQEGTFPGGSAFAGFAVTSGDYTLVGCYRNSSDIPLSTIYKFNASGNSWSAIKGAPSAFKARSFASAVIIGNYLYIAGGASNPLVPFNDTWKVNLITEEWTQLEGAPFAFSGTPAFAIDDIAYFGMGVNGKDKNGNVKKDVILGFDTKTERWFLYYDGNKALSSSQHYGAGFKINNKGYFVSTVQNPAYFHRVR